MIDLDELKRLAEGVGGEAWFDDTGFGVVQGAHVWHGDGDAVCRCFTNIGNMPEPIDEQDVAAFISAANPAVILNLIAEIELLQAQNEAENAELRKDAERMDWMENNATVVSMLDHMRIGFPYPDSVSKNIECIREAIDAARATSSAAVE